MAKTSTLPRDFAERLRPAATSSMTIRELAAAINKRPSTLARELNAFDEGAKLGFADAARIVIATGNPELLHLFAAVCGYTVTPVCSSDVSPDSLRTPSA